MLRTQFDITVAEFSSIESVIPSELAQADVINFSGKIEGGIYHSEGLRWLNDLSALEHPDQAIRSNKERKATRENKHIFESQGYSFEIKPMVEKDFFEFRELYQVTTLQQKRAVHYSLESSIRGKILAGLPVYCAGMYKDGVLESGLVFSVNEAKSAAIVSFGAKKKFPELRGGVGGVLEYELLHFCFENRLQRIDHGRSPNPAGLLNRSGLFEFKARYGNTAYPDGKWQTAFLKNPSVAMKDLIFVSMLNNEVGYVVVSDSAPEDVVKRYRTREVITIQRLTFQECIDSCYSQLKLT